MRRKGSFNITSFITDSDTSDYYFEDDTPCCSLFIIPGNRSEEDYLRNIYARVTTPSPVWKDAIHIEMHKSKNDSNKHLHCLPKYTGVSSRSNKTPTQSLSVNFILREELIGNEVHKIRRLFLNEPWKFHHSFQTLDMEQQRVVAKQPYYELTEEYPLMSPSVTHHGPSILRYNIFVKDNFEDMKYFYMDLLRSQPMYEEDNFCYFTIYSKNGTEIQLSLKQSKQLCVVPTKRTFLKIEIDNVYENLQKIGAKIEEVFCSECGILVTQDPEGNPILVSGKHQKHSSQKPLRTSVRSQVKQRLQNIQYDEDDTLSDCSSGCSECLQNNVVRNVNKRSSRYFYGNQDNSGYYNDNMGYRNDMYGYQNDINGYHDDDTGYNNDDSGYHNDDTSSEDETERYHQPRNEIRRYSQRRTNLTTDNTTTNNTCGAITQQHFPSCKNKGCCDRYGRPFNCCVVNV